MPANSRGGRFVESITERYRLAVRALGKFHELASSDTLNEIERTP